ncbi:MAG: rhomboid family intramembrane serine protease [Janthinobacterium lividum]
MNLAFPSTLGSFALTPVLLPGDEVLPELEPVAHTRERPPSLLAYPATYLLIGINLAVYAAMFRFGPIPQDLRQHSYSSIFTDPFSQNVLVYFGSSTPGRILAFGEWWRLITSTFVHVTLLHLALNMWCLWNLGLFGEPLLGRPGLIAVYVLTGVAGMLQSLGFSLYTGQWSVVAGASGAVFGIAGILIILLSNRKLALPWDELRGLRRQVIFFALANLAIGLAPGVLPAFSPEHLRFVHLDPGTLPRIDNSAHVGGFLCGLALGLPLFPRMTSGRSSYRTRQILVFVTGALVLSLLSYALGTFARSAMVR